MKMLTSTLALALAAALPATGQAPADATPRLDVPASRKLATEGKGVIIDVRDSTAYFGSHVAGALSIPLETVAEKADELKKTGKKVIAYCS